MHLVTDIVNMDVRLGLSISTLAKVRQPDVWGRLG